MQLTHLDLYVLLDHSLLLDQAVEQLAAEDTTLAHQVQDLVLNDQVGLKAMQLIKIETNDLLELMQLLDRQLAQHELLEKLVLLDPLLELREMLVNIVMP